MVQYFRYHQLKKGEHHHAGEDEMLSLMGATSSGYFKRSRPKLFSLLILSLLSCCLILGSHLFCSPSAFSLLCKFLFLFHGFWLSFLCSFGFVLMRLWFSQILLV